MIFLPISNDFCYNKNGIEITAKDLQLNKYGVIVQVTTPYFIYGYHCVENKSSTEIIKSVIKMAAERVSKFDSIYSRMLLDSL